MKKLIPAYVMSFVLIFMLYLYEPLTMYMLNFHDFWFDLSIIIKPLLIVFSSLFIGLSLVFTIIYFINNKFSKKLTVYNISIVVVFVLFICAYIHGNYLSNNLPSLDGTSINWNNYKTENIISIIICLVASIGAIVSCIKFKVENVVKVVPYVSLAILVMLTSSMIASIRPHSWDNKVLSMATTKNYNLASTDRNFIIFLVDAVDSYMFDEVVVDNKKESVFKDFTYYKDTTSAYAYTRDSIPFILSGKLNKNEDDFLKYYNKALDNSPLLKELEDNNYNINLYENDFYWNTNKVKNISNAIQLSRKIDSVDYIKQQTKYVLFKYLPYPLKKYSKIETLDFNNSKISDDVDLYTWSDRANYNRIKDGEIEKTDEKVFKFYHLEGTHVPFNIDSDFNKVTNGTYKEKALACVKIIDAYLTKLKEAGVYDNSVIIILADHGYSLAKKNKERINPILYIKGINEHHDMIRSELPISYLDLVKEYSNLMNGLKSTEIFSDITMDNERRVIIYKYLHENHMVEYIKKGKAWDKNMDNLIPSGNVYDR